MIVLIVIGAWFLAFIITFLVLTAPVWRPRLVWWYHTNSLMRVMTRMSTNTKRWTDEELAHFLTHEVKS